MEGKNQIDIEEVNFQCPVCLESFSKEKPPHILQICGHNLCLICLDKISLSQSESFNCPICRVENNYFSTCMNIRYL